ncbi:hypothetical protein GBA63_13260 [Rubrobacter tropicus]|uniref:Uncharacterized protein n=1 Tax=Rubrobacter tropicus TaxID=2653851 RepID=A0A6G8QAN0_9ACTN|nr:hypothetical protein [Rubrobacter tropicus]QIN83493.1 hypothetical protein GBA63_13260 [Rubrobacter tropicus]
MNGRTGVSFTEEMKGYVSFGEDDYGLGARWGRESGTRLMFRLTIQIEDLDRFEADVRREARAEGWVGCEALGGRRLPVERGVFNLFVDDREPGRKRMLYRLFFRDGVGHPLTLAGFKVVRKDRGFHVWHDTTTLYTRVVRGHVGEDEPGAETVVSGVLRILPQDFLRQLATFRASGSTLAGRIRAIGRFDAMFLGALWQVYGGPLVRRLRGRGR